MTKCYATPGEAPQSTTDVVIVDPSPIWRRGLELLFDSHRSLRVAASVAKVDELRDEGDAAVVVLHQTGTDGGVSMWLAEVETLREARASLRVVGIHRGLDATSLRLAAAAGVDQLVDASSSEAVLLRAVCDPAQPSLRRWEGSRIGPVPLTDRELDVLRLIAKGCTSREIAAALGLSHRTVENYKQRIFGRLDVQSQSQAVALAMRLDLLALP